MANMRNAAKRIGADDTPLRPMVGLPFVGPDQVALCSAWKSPLVGGVPQKRRKIAEAIKERRHYNTICPQYQVKYEVRLGMGIDIMTPMMVPDCGECRGPRVS